MQKLRAFWNREPASKAIVIFSALAVLIIVGGIGNYGRGWGSPSTPIGIDGGTHATNTPRATNTPKATATPQHVAAWTTVQSFKGNGSKTTASFSIGSQWKILWTCTPLSFDAPLYINVSNADGSFYTGGQGVSTMCSASNTHDESEQHAGGKVYLDVISGISWTIDVQELK